MKLTQKTDKNTAIETKEKKIVELVRRSDDRVAKVSTEREKLYWLIGLVS